jgi:hypothetical protein
MKRNMLGKIWQSFHVTDGIRLEDEERFTGEREEG